MLSITPATLFRKRFPNPVSFTDIVYSGNTLSWKISCGGQGGGMEGSGSVTYNGNHMNGTMTMTIAGGANMQIKNIMTGRRIGECDGSTSRTTKSSGNAVGNAVKEDMQDMV